MDGRHDAEVWRIDIYNIAFTVVLRQAINENVAIAFHASMDDLPKLCEGDTEPHESRAFEKDVEVCLHNLLRRFKLLDARFPKVEDIEGLP